jgi:hypothetical protein
LFVDKLSHEWKDASDNEEFSTVFHLRNDSVNSLRLINPRSSCGCTSAVLMGPSVLGPGKSIGLQVRLSSLSGRPSLRARVWVTAEADDGASETLQFELKAWGRALFSSDPDRLRFEFTEGIKTDQAASVLLTFAPGVKTLDGDLKVTSSLSCLHASFREPEKGSEETSRRLFVTVCSENLQSGVIDGRIDIESKKNGSFRFSLPVSVSVHKPVALHPSVVRLGSGIKKVYATSSLNLPFEITVDKNSLPITINCGHFSSSSSSVMLEARLADGAESLQEPCVINLHARLNNGNVYCLPLVLLPSMQ